MNRLVASVRSALRRAVAPAAARGLDRWLLPYLLQTRERRAPPKGRPVHLLLCIADHFEPRRGGASLELAEARVARWVDEYPRLFGGFRDKDGRPPRHTFFYPLEEYEPWALDALASLCRGGFGEVEVHLHHDGETSDSLRGRLTAFKHVLNERHGLLARRRATGEIAYGFIHGNWALDNSRPDGRWCGVNDEIDVLVGTGCYADFTLPSAPSPTQTPTINRIYYATDDPKRPRSHDRGVRLGTAPAPGGSLLMIQGPLVLDWRRRPVPRIENGCLQGSQPPDLSRLANWLRAGVRTPSRPDWYFVKLHTHGAVEANQRVLLGDPMVELHRGLAGLAAADPDFHYHYVTAREMANLALAAEAGWAGAPDGARDFAMEWCGGAVATRAAAGGGPGVRTPPTAGLIP